jgi:hypothetical protein
VPSICYPSRRISFSEAKHQSKFSTPPRPNPKADRANNTDLGFDG